MDFASLMSTAIKSSTSPPPKDSSSSSHSTFLKRSEIEAQRQAAYLKDQESLAAARTAKLAAKRKYDDAEFTRTQQREEKKRRLAEESRLRREEEDDKKERARRKRLGLPDLPPKDAAAAGGEQQVEEAAAKAADIPPPELLAKLRALHEPAILFGETHAQRLHRYTRLSQPAQPSPLPPALSTGPIPTTLSLLPESATKVPPTVPKDGLGRTYLFRQLASYFSHLLTAWSAALASRPASVSDTTQGRAALTAMQQATTNMIPLFRKFETGDLPDSILEPVVEIVRAAQERRYVDANDGYLRLSIGKAAWPIGVTMVGIHERSAREKLHEGDKGAAHIMSDEGTRKFLQSIKRVLTFAQARWPPEDQGQLMG